ncbi:MAG: type IV pilus twitching motility protein PilT [Nitrospirales bacterium]|nr:type IV pilus twitching motility protein PilT [Nitrospirales bacterium]
MEIIEIITEAARLNASDIHIIAGKPPMVRILGRITPLSGLMALSSEETKTLIYSMLYQDQIRRFEERLELDFSYDLPAIGRFRVNVFSQKDGIAAAMRLIPARIPTPSEIGLTDAIVNLTRLPRGLILVTGPTGSGKSTTIASLLNIINAERKNNVITIEDPIEFVYEHRGCIISQREVGLNTHSFSDALKHALRQDPDVILVGEMRDLETIALTLTAAETGHLVFATLHAQDAPQTVDMVIDVFPPHQQQQVRVQLAATLKAVICQQLLPRADGKGRVAAREVMIVTHAIANLIREGKTHQIYSAIETGATHGMFTLEASLFDLAKRQVITMEEAFAKANNPVTLKGHEIIKKNRKD